MKHRINVVCPVLIISAFILVYYSSAQEPVTQKKEETMSVQKDNRVFFYARTESEEGFRIIHIDVRNISEKTVSICTFVPACLRFEIEEKDGKFTPWLRIPSRKKLRLPEKDEFIEIGPDEMKYSAFSLEVAPFEKFGKRAFKIGSEHYFKNLPQKVKYRFVYEISKDVIGRAREFEVTNLFKGPAFPGSEPGYLITYDNKQVLELVAKGDPEAFCYLRPGDHSVLPELDKLLKSSDYDVKENAVYTLIATGLPEAAPMLVKFIEAEENDQLRGYAIYGFLKIHPSSIRDELIRLTTSKPIAEDEFPDMMRSALIQAIGLMDDSSNIEPLRELEKKLRPIADESEPFMHSLDYAFLATYARLGDSESAEKLVDSVLKLKSRDWVGTIQHIDYCKSPIVARGLIKLFDDKRKGTRIAPYVSWKGAPSSPEEAQRRRDFEERAYVFVKDDALYAVTRILKDVDWGFDPSPLRRYTDQEFEMVKKKVQSLIK